MAKPLVHTVGRLLDVWKPAIDPVADAREERDMIRQQRHADDQKKHPLKDWKKKTDYAKHEKQYTKGHA